MLEATRTRLARWLAPGQSGARSYEAASGARRTGAVGSFGAYRQASIAAPRIRARARYLAENAPFCRAGVRNLTAALVGTGSRPLPEAPDALRRALAASWSAWASRMDCDANGETNLAGIEASAVRSMIVDGEALIELVPDPSGLRLRSLPSDLIDSQKTVALGNGREVLSGVEYDPNGRVVAYWLHLRPAGLLTGYQPSRRVDAARIIRLWEPDAPDSVRGVSRLSGVVIAATEFDGLLDALITGARVAASHAGFVTSPEATPENDDPLDLDDSLEPGRMTKLPLGYDVKFSNPQQITSAGDLLRIGVQQIAAGLDVPEHLVSGDMTRANYSSLRAATVAFRARVNQTRSTVIVPRFLNRVWETWLALETLTGRQSQFVATEWIGPAIEGIDPQKDVTAMTARIDARLSSRRAEILATGRDPDRVAVEIAEEGNGAGLA